ncbi:MAG: DUF4430 domain-containing protein [Patescibacteria group bacterium]
MSKNQKIITFVAVIALVAGGLLFASRSIAPENGNLNNIAPVVDEALQEDINLTIVFGPNDSASTSVKAKYGGTCLDILKRGAATLNFDLQTKDYGEMGVLVEKIRDKKNGDGGNYWMYYVDGKLSDVGASQQEIYPGSIVEWRFEKPNF